jgi:hypothetical protein
MTLPNFLFIGPDKTGSSWIFEYLRSHPQCFVPEAKDIYFFDREYHRGLDWYARFFATASPAQLARGELSHDYILSAEVARRIHDDLPGVRLIAAIRDPIDRTFSHYLYMQRSGLTQLPFREALKALPELVENSRYSVMLAPYFELFGQERICCLDFDQLRRDPQAYADRIAGFLGIGPLDASKIGVVRPASRARFFWVARLMKIGAAAARRLSLQNLVGRIKHSGLAQSLYIPIDKTEGPRLSAEDRALLQDIFSDEYRWIATFLKVSPDQKG